MIRSLAVAVSFLTRFPVRLRGEISEQEVAESSAYFGIVGLVVGAVQGLAFWALFPVTPLVAAVGSTIVAVLATGAFHHDGLADSADALVGGWTPEQRREILKDSRLGTYGVMALVLVVLFEVALLAALAPLSAATGLIAANTCSRTAAVTLAMFTDDRGQGLATLVSGSGLRRAVMLVMTGLVVVLCWVGASPVRTLGSVSASLWGLGTLAAVVVFAASSGAYAKRKIGSVTGDTLGAVERLSFGVFLLGWVVLHTP